MFFLNFIHKKYAIMKDNLHLVRDYHSRRGELYVFRKSDDTRGKKIYLIGIFERRVGQEIYLEAYTSNYTDFGKWCRLPKAYIRCRQASRSELRDCICNLAIYEYNNTIK